MLFFALIDPNGVLRRIDTGDLAYATHDPHNADLCQTMSDFRAEEAAANPRYVPFRYIGDKVAYRRRRGGEEVSYNNPDLITKWSEVYVEATSMVEAVLYLQSLTETFKAVE